MSNGREWTNDHTKTLILLNEAGCSDHVVAGATGHDVDTVQRRRSSLGLAPNYRNTYAPWQAIPKPSRRAIAAACARVLA